MRPNEQTFLNNDAVAWGSASVSLVGDGVSLSRTFLKVCFGETPNPTGEMPAPPSPLVATHNY